MIKLKLVALSLVLSSVSIIGACATPEAQVPTDELPTDNTLTVPEVSEDLSESTELEITDEIEEPSLTEEGGSLDETAMPEGEVPSDLEVAPIEGEASETPTDLDETAMPEAEGSTIDDTTMPEAEGSIELEDVTTPEAEVEPVPTEGAE